MTRFAIIIGVEKYNHFSETKFAHADSTLMYSTLVEKCDYAKQNSLLLNISPDDNKSPSDVLAEIRSAISKSTPGDSVLFYFAGHGHRADGHVFLILPNTTPGAFESTALPLDDVSGELREPRRLCFRIFDSCHSGLDVRDGQSKLDAEGFIRAVTHENSGWVTLAACKDDEFSVCDAEIGHGVFTYHMCEYISDLKENKPVYPEMVKIDISDTVIQHAKKLGYSQTPTLNASISGNISLAIRRANSSAKSSGQIEVAAANLCSRIDRLRTVRDIITADHLQHVLQVLIDECKTAFEQLNNLGFEVLAGPPISANEIPKTMHSYLVDFAKQQGLQPRHELVRKEREETYDPSFGMLGPLYSQKRRIVSYYVSQLPDLPPSASIMEIKGDGRCLPNVKVLIYLVPLQITACMLVCAFQCGWPPFGKDVDEICTSHQDLKPNDALDTIKKLAPYAAKRTMTKICNIVENRVAQLERDIGS